MTNRERFLNALDRKPVDLLPCQEMLWGETAAKYVAEGHLAEGEDHCTHFDMAMRASGWMNGVANLDFEPKVIEETEDTVLKLDGNGAMLRTWKAKSGTPEHVDFTVKDRASWEKEIKPHLLKVDRRRVPFDHYRDTKKLCAEEGRAFCWTGVGPFEQMHPVCGHEYMLMGMALDPDWVRDMVMTFADFTIMHAEALIAEHGPPEAFWFYEDMGFKEKPFMSPASYEAIMLPGHRKLFDFAHGHNCKVLVHSCGFVEPLVPGLVEAGMDCLQAMEVKAGMDMPRIAETFGDRISFCGNIDIRILSSNDRAAIEEEMNKKIIPVLDMGSGFILHSDHSIPPTVEHDTLKWFFDHGRRITERMGKCACR